MSKISRRAFTKLSAIGFASALLTACGINRLQTANPVAPSTALPAPTSTPAASVTARVKGQKSGEPPATGNPAFIATEILGRPTDTSVTVNVVPAAAMDITCEYGTAPGIYTALTPSQSAAAGVPLETLIGGLQSNTRYYYRMRSGGATGPEHTFITRRAAGETFTFTIDADPHNRDPNFNAELYAITLNNACNDRPDFHINLGDTFITEKLNPASLEDVVDSYTELRPHLGLIGANAPLFLVNGNHEGELGWLLDGSDHNLAVWCASTRREYYPNPAPDDFYSGSATQEPFIGIRDGYYAWTWGDALFAVLDPFWYTRFKPKSQPDANWGWTLGKAQYDWLQHTLETSAARFKFIFIHHLVGGNDKDARGGIETAGYYEWGGQNQDGSWGFDVQRPGWDLPIHALLVKNRVSAVFHGHDHVFVKQDLDGIVYQECPQPSIARYNNTQLARDYGYVHGDVVSSSGHLRVTIAPGGANVAYVRAYLPKDETLDATNGQVSYQYTITTPD